MATWAIFVSAIGLLFVFEGILPFLAPAMWRRMMHKVSLQPERALRIMGLISMLIGLGLVCLAHDLYPAI